MSCTKNPKKFLWFKYQGRHDWKLTWYGKFMRYTGNTFNTDWECKLCGLTKRVHFTEKSELIRQGITVKQIEKADGLYFGTHI